MLAVVVGGRDRERARVPEERRSDSGGDTDNLVQRHEFGGRKVPVEGAEQRRVERREVVTADGQFRLDAKGRGARRDRAHRRLARGVVVGQADCVGGTQC
eukprot:6204328-Pleurochrysis_carterae.AAC.1